MEVETLPIAPRLGERFRDIYGLPKAPSVFREFSDLARAIVADNPEWKKFRDLIRAGKVVIGEVDEDRGYSVALPTGKEANVACGYDAVMTAVLHGRGLVRARCPHCREPMEIRIEDRTVVQSSPNSITFWYGAPPRGVPGHPICDHLHIFPDPEHLKAWFRTQTDELGLAIPLDDFVEYAGRRAGT